MEDAHLNRKKIKKELLQELKVLKAAKKSSPQEEIESLVNQADFYANYLLKKMQGNKEEQQEQDAQEHHFTRLQVQPSILTGGELKYYQFIGLNWMIGLYQSGISGILADDMGLGKTIQSISILAFLKEYKNISGPHLIIAPKITLSNWMRQFKKWLPCVKTIKLSATKQQRQAGLQEIKQGNFDVVITSYQGVRFSINALNKIKWHYLIIDEAHKIKNEESQLAIIVRKLSNECKLLLTGTPLQNNLHQLWSLLNFLIPEIFTSSEPFDNWNASNEEQILDQAEKQKRSADMIKQLHKILRPFMLRRTKAEVQKSLPGKKQIHVYVGLSELQLNIYKNLLQNRTASENEKRHYLNILMQLRKVCCHPYLFPNIQPQNVSPIGQHLVTASGKLVILDKLLVKLYNEGDHKVLIFSQMTSVLNILEDYCNLRQYSFCRIDGSTDIKIRDQQIEEFMTTDEHFIFLLSTRAGGLGINLTSADTVILYDSDFNPQMDLQAMDRAYRIGQKKFVRVYRLITENSVQQKIIERQSIKLKWDKLVIQQQKAGNQKNKTITKEEMKEMLQFGANEIFKASHSTITEQLIDDLLKRGQAKTDALNSQLQSKMKAPSHLTNLNMDSINIFDCMQRDEQRKRRDKQALDLNIIRENQMGGELRGRRDKIKSTAKQQFVEKKVTVQQHHFYEQKERLRELLQKDEDYKNNKGMEQCPPLTKFQQQQKAQLLQTGFRDWNKSDLTAFIGANQKFGRSNLSEIANSIGKSLESVMSYSQVFWARIQQVNEYERILKQIQYGQQRLQNKKLQFQLLQWKDSKCLTMEFNPTIYTKFKSKLFSVDADRFLAEKALELGTRNITKVKQLVREEPMFRFDHYFRTRNESELNKRLASIYKLIEKQKDNELLGIDVKKKTSPPIPLQDQQPFEQQKGGKKKRR